MEPRTEVRILLGLSHLKLQHTSDIDSGLAGRVFTRADRLVFEFNLVGDSEYIRFLKWVEYDSVEELHPLLWITPCSECRSTETYNGEICQSCSADLVWDARKELFSMLIVGQEL